MKEKLERAHPLLDDLGVIPVDQIDHDIMMDEPSYIIQPESIQEAENVTPRTARTTILEHLK